MHLSNLIKAAPCVLMLWQFSVTASAQESPDPILVCSDVADSAARLACFDQEALKHRAAAQGTRAVPVAPASVTPTPTGTTGTSPAPKTLSEDTTGLDAKQISTKRKAEGLPPEVVKPIVTTLARLDRQSSRHCYFELDNGQVWASTDAQPTLFLAPHETVQITPGLFGAFFLKTQKGSSMRVYRLR